MAMDDNNNYLPHEIVHNILKRLPVKSLLQFQCVCKNWKNMLKDPFFIADHLKQSSHQPSLLYHTRYEQNKPLHLLSFDSRFLQRREFDNTPLIDCLSHFHFASLLGIAIVDSINGILCVRIYREFHLFPPILLLWNPTTKETKMVPTTNDDLIIGDWCVGFGFSEIANDYKIIRILGHKYYHDENDYLRCHQSSTIVNRAQVYTLSKDSWKDIEFGAIEEVYVFPRGTFLYFSNNDGAIIWVGEKWSINHMWEPVIISFDIETEVFTFTKMPPLHYYTFSIPTVYDNKLALLQYHLNSEPCNSSHLWVIQNTCPPGGRWSWIEKYRYIPISPTPYLLVPMKIWRNELVCRVQGMSWNVELGLYKRTLYLLNLNSNEVKMRVMDIGLNNEDDVFNHVESLVPLQGRTLI